MAKENKVNSDIKKIFDHHRDEFISQIYDGAADNPPIIKKLNNDIHQYLSSIRVKEKLVVSQCVSFERLSTKPCGVDRMEESIDRFNDEVIKGYDGLTLDSVLNNTPLFTYQGHSSVKFFNLPDKIKERITST